MRLPGGRNPLLAALLAATGCGLGDAALQPDCALPEFLSTRVGPRPPNVLGILMHVRVRSADSVGLRFGEMLGRVDSSAPAVAVQADSAVVPALGLLPDTWYLLQPVAYGRCGSVAGPWYDFGTGSLPADLPSYRASGSDPSPGFVVFGATPYGLVIDNTGRVVWYHRFELGSGLNFQVQPNGHYVARPPLPPASSTEPARLIEIDPLGNVVRTLGCARGLSPRFHDLLLEPDGSYWTMCDETRTMDLTALGGVAGAKVLGTVIQRVSGTGELLFEWNPFDHFALTDLAPTERAGPNVNWTHGNSLDLAEDGNLVVSFRNLNEITKIDTRTGAVMWRMGGLANQFTWENVPPPAFAAQHGLRALTAGQFLVLDNLGEPESRVERYQYNEAARTVRLLQSYGDGAGVLAQLGGATQSLSGGRILVAFGNGGRVAEYDAGGNVVWRIDGDAGYVYRAQRIRSLYRPGVGDPR